jgi:hypothetical protein
MGRWLTLLFLSVATLTANAEYRAYRLEIVDENSQVLREVLTTMDHLQYPAYYSVNAGEYVRYGDSWMCWGRTDQFAKICPNPAGGANGTQTDDKLRNPASPL